MQVVGWQIAEQLKRRFNLQAARPITARCNIVQSLYSKARRRILRRPGTFYPFSSKTLKSTANHVANLVRGETEAIFFRSSTRWAACEPSVPNFVHTDVIFHTFFHNTFSPSAFVASDLERIWDTERKFLEGAEAVFFESEWGLQQARTAYKLSGDHYFALRNAGGIEPPETDRWDGRSYRIVSIAKHFRQKGGDIVLDLKPASFA